MYTARLLLLAGCQYGNAVVNVNENILKTTALDERQRKRNRQRKRVSVST